MTPLYSLRHLTKCHGMRTVLSVENLVIDSGRLYTLTGANGAGKSTLLQILAFLMPPTAGEVLFRSEAVSWSNDVLCGLRRQVTMLHQVPYLFATTVAANVAFGLNAQGIRGEEARQRVEEAMALVRLPDYGHRRARELSGGEVQRVAMARALALRPRVLLLDEPLANVDRETAHILERVIVALPAKGTTVILTTHDPHHPARLGSEIIHLEAGRLANNLTQHKGKTESCPVLPKPEEPFSTVFRHSA
jgi:tungstate transport system ATP-binding protein